MSPISSASSAVTAAYARYDRAANAAVSSTDSDSGPSANFASAVTEMDQSKIQMTASLLMARKSNEMVANMLNLFDYGAPVHG